jgi:hypothetical protein
MLEGRTQAQSDHAQVYATGRGKAIWAVVVGWFGTRKLDLPIDDFVLSYSTEGNPDIYASKFSIKRVFEASFSF